MHIKVDEDLPVAIARRLRGEGYECSTVVEQGLGGTKDPELWKHVQAEGLFLITADKGLQISAPIHRASTMACCSCAPPSTESAPCSN